jgi:heptosyltransferase III
MKQPSEYQPFSEVNNILIVKLKHIGDVLLATPCIRALKETFPSASISFLVNEGTESMVSNHPDLDETISFPRASMKGLSVLRIRKEIAFIRNLRAKKFDMVVDLTSSDRPAWIALLSGARYRLAYDPQGKGFLGKKYFYTHLVPHPADPNLHEVKKNLGILETVGISCSSLKLQLVPSEKDEDVVRKKIISLELNQHPFVIVHPTSRWLFKCWEDERFASLIDWLQTDCNLPVIFTCGPDQREMQKANQILSLCRIRPKALLGELTLTEWAAVVAKAQLFIGVDSAPMHMAAAQGTPSIALFGPTGFQNWRPWEVKNEVLVHDCPCSRDRQAHCDWKTTRACMKAISLEEVKNAVDKLVARKS